MRKWLLALDGKGHASRAIKLIAPDDVGGLGYHHHLMADATRVDARATPAREQYRLLASIDRRSLAAFRIGLGTLALADLAGRASRFQELHSDAGPLPRAALLAKKTPFVAYLIDGSPTFTSVLATLAVLAALLLIAGFQTRAATFATWLLLCSLHVRNPYVVDGGDRCFVYSFSGECFFRWERRGRSTPLVAPLPLTTASARSLERYCSSLVSSTYSPA